MALEIVGALALGALVLWLVFQPVFTPAKPELSLLEPEAAEESRRGVALLALKEIEFDRATGKLSPADYEMLKARYSEEALAALAAEPEPAGQALTGDPEELIATRLQSLRSARSAGGPASACLRCGPRPETDALFCSSCGLSLAPATFCSQCGATLPEHSHFCAACGRKVAA